MVVTLLQNIALFTYYKIYMTIGFYTDLLKPHFNILLVSWRGFKNIVPSRRYDFLNRFLPVTRVGNFKS